MATLDASTRERIVAAATELIMERGYDKTTMRFIADRAGVSLGSTYYYFSGKEELVQGFYLDIAREHHQLLQTRLGNERSFKKRLHECFIAFLDTCDKYRAVSDSLVSLAIVPTSPLNPFSPESKPARERFVRTFEEVIEGSDLKTESRLRLALPELLWIAQMVIVLAWVQDQSPQKKVTRSVVNRAAGATTRLLKAARLAPMKPRVNDALAALAAVKQSRLERGSRESIASATPPGRTHSPEQ